MTRLHSAPYNLRKARRERMVAKELAEHTPERPHTPAIRQSRFGFSPTTSTLTTTQVTLRRASQQKTTRKPSMPKMPWEDTDA